jgi:hypothetical protein
MIKDRLQIARGSATRITSFLNSFRDYEIIFNTDTNRLGIVLPDKTIVYIGALDINEHNTDTEATHLDIRNAVAEAKAIAEGKSRARVFATKSELDTWLLDDENRASLRTGDNFYIEETDKPDYWWNGTTIKELETQKVDLTEYAKKTELLTLGTTENDAYRGDLGQIAYNHSQSDHAPSNAQANVIEGVQVNGVDLSVVNKKVNVTVPTIPNISLNDNQATAGKYISKIEVDATNKHKLIVTKADLPQVFSGNYEDLTNVPEEFPPTEHNHDDIYYTESEVDTKLGGKANTTHNHTASDITDFPTSMTPTAHNHTASDITDFPTSMTPTAHNHTRSEITDFPTSMPPTEHTHDDRYYTETEVDTKLGGKADAEHTHTKSEITDFPTSMPPTEHTHDDRYYTETEVDTKLDSKADTEHTHTKSEITDFPTTMVPTAHQHTKSEITDFPASMPPTEHTHTKSEITDFPTSMTPTAHTHDDRYYTETEVDTRLGGKADTAHNHTASDITDFPTSMTPTAHNHTRSEITDFPTSMPPTEHNHDSDYYKKTETYSKTEIDNMVGDIETLLGGI